MSGENRQEQKEFCLAENMSAVKLSSLVFFFPLLYYFFFFAFFVFKPTGLVLLRRTKAGCMKEEYFFHFQLLLTRVGCNNLRIQTEM